MANKLPPQGKIDKEIDSGKGNEDTRAHVVQIGSGINQSSNGNSIVAETITTYLGNNFDFVPHLDARVVKSKRPLLLLIFILLSIGVYITTFVATLYFFKATQYDGDHILTALFLASGIYVILLSSSFIIYDKIMEEDFFNLYLNVNSIRYRKKTYKFGENIWKMKVVGWRRCTVQCFCLTDKELKLKNDQTVTPYLIYFVLRNEAHAEFLKDRFYTQMAKIKVVDEAE